MDEVGVAGSVVYILAVDFADGFSGAAVYLSRVVDDCDFGYAVAERVGDFDSAFSI